MHFIHIEKNWFTLARNLNSLFSPQKALTPLQFLLTSLQPDNNNKTSNHNASDSFTENVA